ncbi:MAG TPA: YdeI/OmpD-associated family protein [Sphingopyxis sp.]|uniref:YdeI/OmpD-associated family protein n=1 Tax=Sphingopyxis sp. TaxID=1908224 RepID=UPI002B92786D|nr:YdeI/OmpD-associated family protein [Sphingopyxis sp.]HWW57470.1 YdeI/OmpD-associated family protein [Sphingopyxis sp.]
MAGLTRDPRIDAYIARAQPFAQPILTHLRDLVHQYAPGAEEALKWGVPHFVLHGQNLAGMAAFKKHATFGFWRDEEVTGSPRDTGAMGSMGRLASLADLPGDDAMAALIVKAAALCAGNKPKRPAPKSKPALDLPGDLGAALKANAAAQGHWDGFSPGKRRDYIEWVIEAKREETRVKRIETIVAQVAEGKDRNWKYKGC